jgi:hypothetical protein
MNDANSRQGILNLNIYRESKIPDPRGRTFLLYGGLTTDTDIHGLDEVRDALYRWAQTTNGIITCERFRPEVQPSPVSPAATNKGKLSIVHRAGWAVGGPMDWFLDWDCISEVTAEGRIRHLAITIGSEMEQSCVFASISGGKQNPLIDLNKGNSLLASFMMMDGAGASDIVNRTAAAA